MPEVPLPPFGSVPYIPPNREQAERRDALVLGAPDDFDVPDPEVPWDGTNPPPRPTAMSVGSPAADDALVAALEAAHSFVARVTGWKGEEGEREQVLDLTTAALDAILPGA